MTAALSQEVPFITTLSVIQDDRGELDDTSPKMIKELLNKKDDMQIYEKNGMLIFIPHSFLPDKTVQEKLQALDINLEEDLKKITAQEVLTLSKPKPSFDSLIDLFSKEPKANKSIYLFGNPEMIALINKYS